MRKCAWIECKQEVANPVNRRSIWCPEHLTEQIVNHAYEPDALLVADAQIQKLIDEQQIRQEAKRRACAYQIPHWTLKDLCAVILLCIASVLSVVIGAWIVVGLSKGVWWLILLFLRLIHLA